MFLRLLGLFPLIVALFAYGQERQIAIRAVDGRNGKPLADQRLLVFSGLSPDDVHFHKGAVYDIRTDSVGIARLRIDPSKSKVLNVFVDFMHVCSMPDLETAEVISTGLNAPNACGTLKLDLLPNRLVIFARPRTLKEKMQQ